MAKPFQLEILTPERAFYRGECISVIVPVSDGMLGIMANHTRSFGFLILPKCAL